MRSRTQQQQQWHVHPDSRLWGRPHRLYFEAATHKLGCMHAMCRRAVEANSSRLNFVPTHHWLPDENAPNGISSFCYIDSVRPSTEDTTGSNEYKCFPWSQATIQEYTAAMTMCFAEAFRQGLTLYVRWVGSAVCEG